MRMGTFCIAILCAAVLTPFTVQSAQSEMMKMPKNAQMLMMPGGMMVPAPSPMQQGDMMMMKGMMPMAQDDKVMVPPNMKGTMMDQDTMKPMPPMVDMQTDSEPDYYTSPNGIMKHRVPKQMKNRRMMMKHRKTMIKDGTKCCQGMGENCPKMKMRMMGMTPPKSCCGGSDPKCPMMKFRRQMGMQTSDNMPMQNMKGMPTMDDMHGMMRQGMMNQKMMMMHDNMANGMKCGPECPMMGDKMMPKGAIQHNMAMQQGGPFYNQMKRILSQSNCTLCAKINTQKLTPAMRTKLMQTLTNFAAENKPIYDELKRLRHESMTMNRMGTMTSAKIDELDQKRAKARQALMGNLLRQTTMLDDKYDMKVTPKQMLVHHMHQSGMTAQKMMMYMNTPHMKNMQMQHNMKGMNQMDLKKGMKMDRKNPLEKGYRAPQEKNPQYNQEYLQQAPMREGYTGQTYQ